MSHDHNHDHHHNHGHDLTGARLRNALALTVVILVIEVGAGFAANSLALLSDAGHILTDVFSLGLAWIATRLSARQPDERNTFGYRRSGILAAFINSMLLVLIAGAILVEAVIRLRRPEHVSGGLIIPAALAAVAVNGYIALGLRGEREHNLNVRAAFLHVVGDLAASAGVIVAGIVILVWHAYLADPILSAGIALLIAYGAWNITQESILILMEGTPRDVDPEAVQRAMREIPGVDDVHDLHVWALADGFRLLSAHVVVPDQRLMDTANLLANVKLLLRRRFQIAHATIELECNDCSRPQPQPIRLVPPSRGART